MSSFIYSVAILLLYFIRISEQIKCHSCLAGESLENLPIPPGITPVPKCPDDLTSNTALQPCPSDVKSCYKFDVEIDDLSVSVRTCGMTEGNKTCEMIHDGIDRKVSASMDCYSCSDRDGCNSASSTIISLLSIALITVIVKFIS